MTKLYRKLLKRSRRLNNWIKKLKNKKKVSRLRRVKRKVVKIRKNLIKRKLIKKKLSKKRLIRKISTLKPKSKSLFKINQSLKKNTKSLLKSQNLSQKKTKTKKILMWIPKLLKISQKKRSQRKMRNLKKRINTKPPRKIRPLLFQKK